MEELIKKKHIKLLPPTQLNIVSSTGTIDGKTDSGWKEVMSKISEAHKSELAKRYNKKSVKDTQIERVIKKHRAKEGEQESINIYITDFDFLDDFDTSGDWGFSSVASKPSETQSKETQEVVKQTADGVGKVYLVR